MSKLSKVNIRTVLAAVFYLGLAFVFLQVNQQKRAGMVCTNNMTYSEQIYKPFQ